MAKKVFSFTLSEEQSAAVEAIANAGGISRSQAVDDAIYASVVLMRLGRQQLLEAVRTLHRRVGDGIAIVWAEKDPNGEPDARLVVGHGEGADLEGLRAKGHVIGDRCYLFLDFGDLIEEAAAVKIGHQVFRVPAAQLHIGDVSWPPDPREAIRFPIEQYAKAELADPDPLTPVEA
jgi:hypothetical protein